MREKIENMLIGATVVMTVYALGFIKGGRRVADKVFELTDLTEITINILTKDGKNTATYGKKK